MYRILFCAARGARVRATPDDAVPTIILVPLPTMSLNDAVADAGSAPSSLDVTTSFEPLIDILPPV